MTHRHTPWKRELRRSLLLGDSESSSGSSSGLCLLTSNLESPIVSETSVASDLLHSFQILSELGVQLIGDELSPCSFSDISLSVQEPFGNVVVYTRKSDIWNFNFCLPVGLAMMSLIFSISYSVNSPALFIKLLRRVDWNSSLPFVEVNLGDFADEVRESSTDTLDNSESKHDLAFTFDVCVLDSQNVSELACLSQYNRWL